MNKNHQTLKQLLIISTFSLSLYTLYAWTTPTATFPNGNVAAPLNIGSQAQVKSGNLTVGGIFKVGNFFNVSNGETTIQGKAYSSPTLDTDPSSSLVTKGYVDGRVGGSSIPTVNVYDVPGSYTFTVPNGVTKVMVDVVGGGGGGAKAAMNFLDWHVEGFDGGDSTVGILNSIKIKATGGMGGHVCDTKTLIIPNINIPNKSYYSDKNGIINKLSLSPSLYPDAYTMFSENGTSGGYSKGYIDVKGGDILNIKVGDFGRLYNVDHTFSPVLAIWLNQLVPDCMGQSLTFKDSSYFLLSPTPGFGSGGYLNIKGRESGDPVFFNYGRGDSLKKIDQTYYKTDLDATSGVVILSF